jgi:deazaflavin-dependent oxidoreductase (nitroreductase family)
MALDDNGRAVAEFRASRGALGGPFENARTVVLTTRRPGGGGELVQPVAFHYGEKGSLLLVAVPADDGTLPEWYGNVLANPRVSVETGTAVIEADARPLTGWERDTVYARLAEATPALPERQRLLAEPIPIVALRTRSRARLAAEPWGDELKAVHDGFRRELALIRAEIAAGGPKLAAQLRINCLTACAMLHHHHVTEDDEVFPKIGRLRPDLAAAVRRLREEHHRLRELVGRLQELVSEETSGSAPALAELDGLTAEIEAHLDYEEEQLVPVLNSLRTK